MALHIAFFRSLNVGGKNVIKMDALTALFLRFGAAHARAYIQSGNILFESAQTRELMDGVSKALRDEHNIDVPVTLRTPAALREVLAKNPFAHADHKLVLVLFMLEPVTEASHARFDFKRSPPDEVQLEVGARELYLHCPQGIGKTKFTNAYLDKALGSASTGRNLNTLEAIASLASRAGNETEAY